MCNRENCKMFNSYDGPHILLYGVHCTTVVDVGCMSVRVGIVALKCRSCPQVDNQLSPPARITLVR